MSDNVKTVEQFLETARLETGDVWMDNHDWRHLIEMVEQLAAERDALKAELAAAQEQLENEKFERWQEDQQRNILQQEVSELHALNLYDLVGDPDPLRAEMVSTIRERDELRKGLDAARKQTGIAIARAEYDKAGLRADLVLADALYEAVYGLYQSSGEEDWSEIEPAMKAYGKARGVGE